jgi:hypothetical protein
MTERDKFIARFEEKKSRGMIDVKFFVRPGVKLTEEEFCAQANHIDDFVGANHHLAHGDLKALDAEMRASQAESY